MSGDEIVALVIAVAVAAIAWIAWYARCRAPLVRRVHASRVAEAAGPVVPLLLLPVLVAWSSADVRTSFLYTAFYVVMGLAWVGLGMAPAQPLVGVRLTVDVAERGNVAAATALLGACAGLTLAFAGGNVGDGPGWWVVVGCAGLSTGGWFGAWLLLNATSRVHEQLAVERDLAAGVRSAGFSVALGLVLGRAVAGDYVDAGSTIADFVDSAWPALVLVAVEAVWARVFRPRAEEPQPPVFAAGVLPALAHVAIGLALAALQGPW